MDSAHDDVCATTPEPLLRGVPASLSQQMGARVQQQALETSNTVHEGVQLAGPAAAAANDASRAAQQAEPAQAQQDEPRLGMLALEDLQTTWSGFVAQTLQPSVGQLDQAVNSLIGLVNGSLQGATAERDQMEEEISRMVGLIDDFKAAVKQALQGRGGGVPYASQ